VNESVLYTIAEVAVTLAGFSGVAVVFRLQGAHTWTPTELRVLWLLIADSLLALLLSLLPVPLALASWSDDVLWGFCSALLGSWFIIGALLAVRAEIRERSAGRSVTVPVITPVFNVIFLVSLVLGVALWLSVFGLVQGGQALYVLGLIALLASAGVEFCFFIGLMAQQARQR
jgi:hypothetical protein